MLHCHSVPAGGVAAAIALVYLLRISGAVTVKPSPFVKVDDYYQEAQSPMEEVSEVVRYRRIAWSW
jgi:hypothetical protein